MDENKKALRFRRAFLVVQALRQAQGSPGDSRSSAQVKLLISPPC